MTERFPDADPTLLPLSVLLPRAGVAVGRFRQRAAAGTGLSATALGVLDDLARRDAVSQRELAGGLGVAPATLTPVLDALDSAGRISRQRDPADRRVLRVSITEAGRDVRAVAHAAVEAELAERLPGVDPDRESVIRGYLAAVLAAARDDSGG